MKNAQTADQDVDVSSDVTGYKQAVDNLSASISACVGADLLSEEADVVADARKLEGKMEMKLRSRIALAKEMLLGSVSRAETTRELAPLSVNLGAFLADEVLRQSCGDAVESAEKLLAILRAEEKERMVAVSAHFCSQ